MDYSGFHVGIVVENDDPKFWGRVKVFVPEHAPNLDKLNKWIDEGKLPSTDGGIDRELFFNAIDKEISPDLVAILDELKEYLPWAEYAGPIFGGSGNGRFRCATKTTSINDTSEFGSAEAQNGYRPLNNFTEDNNSDDFAISTPGIDITNPNASDYEPCNYSGMIRGVFSIPNVGSQVYVFYLNNDPMYPVYFATSYNPDSIKQIFTNRQKVNSLFDGFFTYDYPGDFENSNQDTEASKTFTSKTVLNSNKHTIELIDTDDRESIKIQHYAGGFKEFNNSANIEFAPANDQKLVRGDSFETVKGKKALSVASDVGIMIGGNVTTQIGKYSDLHEELEKKFMPVMREVGKIAQLFPVRRTLSDMTPKDCSPEQKMEPIGGFIVCPTCGGLAYDPFGVNGLNTAGTYQETNPNASADTEKNSTVTIKSNKDDTEYTEQMSTSGEEMSRVDYGWSKIPRAVSHCVSLFEEKPPYFKDGKGTHADAGKIGYFGGIQCPTCNNKFWRERNSTKEWTDLPHTEIGKSPSTEGGSWVEETARQSNQMLQTYLDSIDKTKTTFSNLGDNGEKVERVSMSKVEVIGAVFNDMPSYRVDPIGKLRIDGLFVTQQATVPYYLPTPHVEPVDVPPVPGGDYNLTIGNKWTVNVGSNGISIGTTGRMQFYGGISEISTQELTLCAKHDMVIDGGERMMLRARKMTINPVEHNALTIDGQLHVMRNAIVRGGLLIEGETAVQHVTAPGELAVTQTEMYTGGETEGCTVNVVITLGLGMEGVAAAGAEAGAEAESAQKKKKCNKWKSWKCFKSSGTGAAIIGGTIGAVTGAITGGAYGAIGGGIQGAFNGYFRQREINRLADSFNRQFSAVSGALNSLIEALSGPLDAELWMPSHNHAFLQIPTSFKDCPNGVRAQLLQPGNNINSRTLLLAARRRHHTGAYQPDPRIESMYLANPIVFDTIVFSAMIQGLPALATNLSGKGIAPGVNPQGGGSPKCYGLLCGGYSNGDTGLLAFYTIRDYYNKTTNVVDHALAASNASRYQYVACMVTFKLTGDGDELFSGDADNPTGTTTQSDNLLGYMEETIDAEMTGINDYVNQAEEVVDFQMTAWLGAYQTGV